LCWHENNNGNYLRSLLAVPGSTPSNPSLITNGTFEAGSGNSFTNWSVLNGASYVSAGTGAGEMYQGTRSLKAAPVAAGNPWSVQIASDAITTTSGTAYKVRFYAKAAAAGGKFRLSNSPAAQYSADYFPGTSWAPYEWTFTANDVSKKIVFDMGSLANTYYIDSVSVTLVNPPAAAASFAEQRLRIDSTLKSFITAMMNRYKDKVHAWDVANEVLDNNGILRTGISSSDAFYWGDYMGDRTVAGGTAITNGDSLLTKVFNYAHAVDPTAKLFLNDYGHESNPRKMDSLIALVARLKANGVPIDGVGLQMHMSYLNPTTGIDNALIKMAQLGLLVRITELDISVNLGNQNDPQTANFVVSPTMFPQQAAKFKYVAESYIRNVPEAQRYGITVWGVSDRDSWLRNRLPYHTKDYPLLWDEDYNKKEAYTEFLKGLQLQ
jgi:endo-1,4-beta-xylanase